MDNLLFNDNEYQLYNDQNIDDYYFEDTKKMYYSEVSKYSLLTDEEEVRLGKMLYDPEKKKLLAIKRKKYSVITDLNTAILFNSLCNNKSYEEILNSIIAFYTKLNSNNDKTIEILKKDLKEAKKVNRALNKDELLSAFNISEEIALEEKELLYEIKEFMNYKFAYDKMFLANLRLVASIAANYHSNIDFMDLVNEGNLGLMRAIYGFDVTLGNKFSTFATYWIKFFIRRAAINSYRMMKVPEQVLYDAFKLRDKIM